MSTAEATAIAKQNKRLLAQYITGLVLSLLFTLTAYVLVQMYIHHSAHALSRHVILPTLGGLALAQFIAQLIFFLHLGHDAKPRWKVMVFWFMILVVVILVVGSMWIMYNLNYNMSPQDINTYMDKQDGL